MTTTFNPDLLTTIAQNLCNQIIAFQQSIAARPEGQQFPTLQEGNQQHKLITCLLRLVKQPARPRKEKVPATEELSAIDSWKKAVDEIFGTDEITPLETANYTASTQTTSNIVTQRDFEQYGHQLGKSTFANLTDKTTIKFNGRYVNAKWLEYNLLQYHLPLEQRNFIDDSHEVLAQIDYKANREKITAFIADHKKAA